jgi:hypothetical protein
MNIQDKIDEIRKKPDHVRIRYAWTLSIIATSFVILIWIISLAAGRKETPVPVVMPDKSVIFDNPGTSGGASSGTENATPNFGQNSSAVPENSNSGDAEGEGFAR